MKTFDVNKFMQGTTVVQNPKIEYADSNLHEAGLKVKNAMQELGKAYFDANRENTEAEYYEQITCIKKCMDNEILWHQYRLSLEDKVLCENCGAVNPFNSLFCNQCGNNIRAVDFSVLGVDPSVRENTSNTVVCRVCGKPLVSGAAFCEVCGTKV